MFGDGGMEYGSLGFEEFREGLLNHAGDLFQSVCFSRELRMRRTSVMSSGFS